MKPLSRLETLVASIVERPAWLLSTRKLHPLVLTAALTKALEERAMRLADRVVAPDRYDTLANPADLAAFGDALTVLERELADYLSRTIRERDLTANRPPTVRLRPNDALRPGQVTVEAHFSEPLDTSALDATIVRGFDDRLAAVVRRVATPQPATTWSRSAGRQLGYACLQLLGEGNDAVRTFPLHTAPLVIGRREGSTIFLPDSKVSREHARIDREGEGYAITDLHSTNGTFVNGREVRDRRRLRDGDVLQCGHFRLRFLAAG